MKENLLKTCIVGVLKNMSSSTGDFWHSAQKNARKTWKWANITYYDTLLEIEFKNVHFISLHYNGKNLNSETRAHNRLLIMMTSIQRLQFYDTRSRR